jgi:hypothetical protein
MRVMQAAGEERSGNGNLPKLRKVPNNALGPSTCPGCSVPGFRCIIAMGLRDTMLGGFIASQVEKPWPGSAVHDLLPGLDAAKLQNIQD